ncbi:MAG: PAS domain S-box protein [Dissulfurispiraceae bacterium]
MKSKISLLAPYASAIALVGAAFLIRQALLKLSGSDLPPWITFYPTVMLVALIVGFRPGLLATVTSVLAAYYSRGFVFQGFPNVISTTLFVGMGIFMSAIAERYRGIRNHLEELVATRTADLIRNNEQLEQEVSDRKVAEEALRESETEFRLLAESMPQIVWATRPDGWNIYFNQQWVDYTGLTLEESYGHGWNIPFHPDDKQRAWEAWQEATKNGSPYDIECRLRRADGVYKWWLIRGAPVLDASGTIIKWFGTCTDIDDIKLAEQKLLSQNLKNATLLRAASDGIHILDIDGNVIQVNEAFCRMLGYTPDQMKNMNVAQWDVQWSADELKERIPNQMNAQRVFETKHRRSDNRVIDVEISSVGVEIDGKPMLFNSARDITERKKSEHEKANLEAQLRQAQKMEAVGQLAGGIAHDFNNILSAIVGYAYLLQSRLVSNDPSLEDVKEILESAHRGAEVTHSLLAFSRMQVINLKPVSINDILRRTEKLLSRVIRENIKINTVLSQDEVKCIVDAAQIEQVLMNLATNARDAMPRGGRLTLSTDYFEMDEAFILDHRYGKLGKYALISVSDTGVGMSMETASRIFEPFFTTKETGKGTGLGLAMVYGIIKQHDGYVDVYSELGKGTTFKLYLPATELKKEEGMKAVELEPLGGTETILVTEDDDKIRRLYETILKQKGYKIILAKDGEEAIEQFSKNKDVISLVLLDMIMPNKGGKEVYDEIRRVKRDMKVLFASGYSADKIDKEILIGEHVDFLFKPLSPINLLSQVRAMLDK